MLENLFDKVAEPAKPATLMKGDSNTGIFLWNLQSFFKHAFFYRTSLLKIEE